MNRATLTTEEAATRLGVTVGRVRQLIAAGRLPARKFGHVHAISEDDLKLIKDRKPGRPPKPKDEVKAEKAVARRRVRKKDPTRLLKTLS